MTGEATAASGIGALEIATQSGAVIVWARPITQPEVLRGSAEIRADGVVRTGVSSRVEIACPEGTDVIIGSTSGRIECHGPLGRVAITGHSGRISVEQAQSIDVRASSGRVTIGRCAELCRVAATSGGVRIEEAGALDVTITSGRLEAIAVGDAQVHSASGRVVLGLTGAGSVDVRTVSGRVAVTVPPGIEPALHLVSRSGRVRSEVISGTDGRIGIESFSGSIKVTRS
jgi:DUF4097 and DUF4098 domain-containing protein YvlB